MSRANNHISFAFLLLVLLSYPPAQANTFGENTRKQWNGARTTPYPLNQVGTLKRPDGNRCTASYIENNLILTAAHCVMEYGKNRLKKGEYQFEHNQGVNGEIKHLSTIDRFHYITLRQIEDGGVEAANNHWAILELNTPATSPGSYFEYPQIKGDDLAYGLSIVGFSPEFNGHTKTLTFSDSNCGIKEHLFDGLVALHDCDAGPRDSGAPLYKCSTEKGETKEKCHIYAIHVAAFSKQGLKHVHYSRDRANVSVTTKSFFPTIQYLKLSGDKPDKLISVNNYLRPSSILAAINYNEALVNLQHLLPT